MYDFTGKRILVTGAGKGIGREIAIVLSKSGCHVTALSRTQADLDTLVKEYPGITTINANVAEWNDTKAKLEQLDAMDGLVNNAGIGGLPASCLDSSPDFMKKLMDTNLISAINITQIIAKKMIAQGKSGSIVNNSSLTSLAPIKSQLSYTLSKAGMDMMTKQFALELGPHNIRANTVNVTLVVTPLVQSYLDQGLRYDEAFKKIAPIGRIANVKEIVEPVLYLLSDKSSMVTGTHHVVDGGILSCIMV